MSYEPDSDTKKVVTNNVSVMAEGIKQSLRQSIKPILRCVLFIAAAASMFGQKSPSTYLSSDSVSTEKSLIENTTQIGTVDSVPAVSLDILEYWVVDTAESISFRLHVRNTSDSLVIIDRVEPSCGCILTTIQKSFARKGKDGEIYIALMTGRMSDIQPYTVDVYTSADPANPLRLYIRKKTEDRPNRHEQ